MLENHSAIVAATIDLASVDSHAATARRIETHGHTQRRRLAAAGRAYQSNDFPVLDRKADAIERLHVMELPIYTQRKAFGHVEESHLTHSILRTVANAQ